MDGSALIGRYGDTGQWRRALFLSSVLLLGIPLTGEIPTPPGLARAAGPSTTYSALTQEALVTAIVWAAIYSLAGLLLMGSRRSAIAIIRRQPAAIVLVLFALLTTFWTVNATKCVLDSLQSGGLLLLALGAAISYSQYPERFTSDLSWTLGISQLINLATIVLNPDVTADSDGRWTGVTGSANYLGQLSFCAVWASTAASFTVSALGRVWHLVLLIVGIVVLCGTGSVSSGVAAFLACCLTVIWIWVRASSRTRVLRWMTIWTVVVWFVAVLMSTGFQEWISRFFDLVGRESHFTGRIGIWLSAVSAFLEKPWLGYGFGADTESIGAISWATSFHNGFLDLAVKGGVVALALLLLFMAHCWRDVKRSMVLRGGALIPWMPFATVSLVYNLTESSFTVARSPAWVVLITISLISAATVIVNVASERNEAEP